MRRALGLVAALALAAPAATAADLEQIVYLGGLGDNMGGTLSPHLASRHEALLEVEPRTVASWLTN